MRISEEVRDEIKQLHNALLKEIVDEAGVELSWEAVSEEISEDEYSSCVIGWFLAKGKMSLVRNSSHSNFKTVGV